MDRAVLADPVVPSLWGGGMIASPTERCRQMFHDLVGRRTGIVRDVRFVSPIDGDADLYHAAATIAGAYPDWVTDFVPASGGSGRTREDALMAALGEGIERYSASSYCRGRAILRRESELPSTAVHPAELAQFSADQRNRSGFPFPEVTPQTPLRWVTGKRLSDGSPCAVPAFAVYLPYHPEPGEPLVAPGISTGLACAESRVGALAAGLCEVIERDALALTWLAGISPRRIDQRWFVDQTNGLMPPTDVTAAYDLTGDLGLPIVLVVCRGLGPRGPIVSVGSACRLDPRAAVRKAATEASQDRVYVRHLVERQPDWRPLPDFSNVADFSYHARLYSIQRDLADEAFSFLDGNPTPSDLPELYRSRWRMARLTAVPSGPRVGENAQPVGLGVKRTSASILTRSDMAGLSSAKDLDEIARRLVDAGHDGAWVDLTPPWAKSLGLHVVKVILPTLMPLHGHHAFPQLGHRRLRTSRTALPHGVITHDRSLWRYPHPFP